MIHLIIIISHYSLGIKTIQILKNTFKKIKLLYDILDYYGFKITNI